ncbi:MAG: response regulator [Bryobacterales bacterium]|nr:response regulator [Bryobacterales bacterium]
MKVMVVDDEADVRLLFEQRFRKEIRSGEIEFYFALSAQEALEFLETHEEDVLILSDINMPGMNGLDLLKTVKSKHRHLKVFMITAYGDAEYQRRAWEYGCDDYLTKPIDFGMLKEKLLR